MLTPWTRTALLSCVILAVLLSGEAVFGEQVKCCCTECPQNNGDGTASNKWSAIVKDDDATCPEICTDGEFNLQRSPADGGLLTLTCKSSSDGTCWKSYNRYAIRKTDTREELQISAIPDYKDGDMGQLHHTYTREYCSQVTLSTGGANFGLATMGGVDVVTEGKFSTVPAKSTRVDLNIGAGVTFGLHLGPFGVHVFGDLKISSGFHIDVEEAWKAFKRDHGVKNAAGKDELPMEYLPIMVVKFIVKSAKQRIFGTPDQVSLADKFQAVFDQAQQAAAVQPKNPKLAYALPDVKGAIRRFYADRVSAFDSRQSGQLSSQESQESLRWAKAERDLVVERKTKEVTKLHHRKLYQFFLRVATWIRQVLEDIPSQTPSRLEDYDKKLMEFWLTVFGQAASGRAVSLGEFAQKHCDDDVYKTGDQKKVDTMQFLECSLVKTVSEGEDPWNAMPVLYPELCVSEEELSNYADLQKRRQKVYKNVGQTVQKRLIRKTMDRVLHAWNMREGPPEAQRMNPELSEAADLALVAGWRTTQLLQSMIFGLDGDQSLAAFGNKMEEAMGAETKYIDFQKLTVTGTLGISVGAKPVGFCSRDTNFFVNVVGAEWKFNPKTNRWDEGVLSRLTTFTVADNFVYQNEKHTEGEDEEVVTHTFKGFLPFNVKERVEKTHIPTLFNPRAIEYGKCRPLVAAFAGQGLFRSLREVFSKGLLNDCVGGMSKVVAAIGAVKLEDLNFGQALAQLFQAVSPVSVKYTEKDIFMLSLSWTSRKSRIRTDPALFEKAKGMKVTAALVHRNEAELKVPIPPFELQLDGSRAEGHKLSWSLGLGSKLEGDSEVGNANNFPSNSIPAPGARPNLVQTVRQEMDEVKEDIPFPPPGQPKPSRNDEYNCEKRPQEGEIVGVIQRDVGHPTPSYWGKVKKVQGQDEYWVAVYPPSGAPPSPKLVTYGDIFCIKGMSLGHSRLYN